MKLRNDFVGQWCVANLIFISFLSGGTESYKMGKLKTPSVPNIEGQGSSLVSQRRKLKHFVLVDFWYNRTF